MTVGNFLGLDDEQLAIDTPRFVIESDATIVAPLIFAYVLAEA